MGRHCAGMTGVSLDALDTKLLVLVSGSRSHVAGGLKAGSPCPDQLLSAFSLKEAQALKRKSFQIGQGMAEFVLRKRDILMIKEDFTLGCKDRIWERGTVMNFLLLLGPRSQDHVCMWMKEVSLRSENQWEKLFFSESCFIYNYLSAFHCLQNQHPLWIPSVYKYSEVHTILGSDDALFCWKHFTQRERTAQGRGYQEVELKGGQLRSLSTADVRCVEGHAYISPVSFY